MKKLMHFLKNEDGVTAIEYSLIAALIAVAIIVMVTAVGDSVNNVFSEVSEALDVEQQPYRYGHEVGNSVNNVFSAVSNAL